MKACSAAEQGTYIKGADLVIQAFGYQTNNIPIFDYEKKPVNLSQKQPFSQYDVDAKCRLVTSDNHLLTKTNFLLNLEAQDQMAI